MRKTCPLTTIFLSLLFLSSTRSFAPTNSPGPTSSSKMFWSRSIEVAPDDCVVEDSTLLTVDTPNQTYDLSSPREWLEWCEFESGIGGCYTVLRCDYSLQTGTFHVWGNDFHNDRLLYSVKALCPGLPDDPALLENSTTANKAILAATFKDAESTLNELKCQLSVKEMKNASIIFMVTILWQPTKSGEIKVRGHALSTLQPASSIDAPLPDPLIAAIALDEDLALPNRFEHSPTSKLSAWCRRRRPLERQFKTNGAGEVLLMKSHEGKIQLLEGLTSNVFAVYPGNIIRTPPNDCVLGGYARQLVLDYAERCGLKAEVGPLCLEDAHLWQEIFLTSSIKIVAPVKSILLPSSKEFGSDGRNATFVELWKDARLVQDKASTSAMQRKPIWQVLLQEILKSEGCDLS